MADEDFWEPNEDREVRASVSEDKQSQSLLPVVDVFQIACLETPLTKRSQGVCQRVCLLV